MCGRYTQTLSLKELAQRFTFLLPDTPQFELLPRFNIAPSQEAPVIIADGPASKLEFMRWGLIPAWAKDAAIGFKTINARAETLSDKPAFKEAFERRRCLVPSDGFYEWKKEGKLKLPMRITLRSGEAFAMAGLWDRWRDRAGREIRSFSIVTVSANEDLAGLHERMPAILAPEEERLWIEPLASRDRLRALLHPAPRESVLIAAASTIVNSALNEGPRCLKP